MELFVRCRIILPFTEEEVDRIEDLGVKLNNQYAMVGISYDLISTYGEDTFQGEECIAVDLHDGRRFHVKDTFYNFDNLIKDYEKDVSTPSILKFS